MGDSQGISVCVKSAAETRLNTLASTMWAAAHTHTHFILDPEALSEQCHLKVKSLWSSVF